MSDNIRTLEDDIILAIALECTQFDLVEGHLRGYPSYTKSFYCRARNSLSRRATNFFHNQFPCAHVADQFWSFNVLGHHHSKASFTVFVGAAWQLHDAIR